MLNEETNWGIGEVNTNFTGLYGYYRGEYLDGNGWDPWAEGGVYVPTARPWYKGAIESNGDVCFVTPYLDMDTGNIVLSVTKMLKDGRSVCGLDITLSEVSKYAKELNSYGTDYAYIIDSTGFIVSAKTDEDWGRNYLENSKDDTNNVYGDPLRTEQIVLNIVSNAIKYTNPGGSVDIYLNESAGSDEDNVKFSFTVQDTGIGMSIVK